MSTMKLEFYSKAQREALNMSANVMDPCAVITCLADKEELMRRFLERGEPIAIPHTHFDRSTSEFVPVWRYIGDVQIKEDEIYVFLVDGASWIPLDGKIPRYGTKYIWSPIHAAPDIKERIPTDMLVRPFQYELGKEYVSTKEMSFAEERTMPIGTKVKLIGFNKVRYTSKAQFQPIGLYPDGSMRNFYAPSFGF